MMLPLILALDPEEPLRGILHPFERYTLDMKLEDMGIRAPWATVLAWETAGEVQEWVRRQG